ncbi:ASPC1 protein, partial [Acromyrmex insinuator]
MAANKTVIVLAPNGRRQNVKVTINTTILQVLEEVCQKQGFNVDDYDIKHNRQILDPNTIFRFTGLPNNAQLEMVACTKTRTMSNVTIGIQPEDGQRILREFSPDTTLAQALMEMYPNSDLERAVLIYMHREVCGKEALEKTTLKSLGLNSGKAILRLMYRDHEQLKTQAHISTPLLPKSVANDSSSDRKVPSSSPYYSKTNETINLPTESTSKIENQEESRDKVKIDIKDETVDALSDKKQEKDTFKIKESHSIASSHEDHDKSGTNRHIAETCAEVQENAYEIKEQLEDAPLLTEAQRQLDQNKHILDRLVKYRRAVIRIQFPDQFVLQGLFEPLETIKAIKDFIKSYLENPDCEFTIYTSPPRHILNPDARLIDENLVPSAIVYYSGPSSLNSNVKEQLTDPRAAGIEAVKSRIATMRKEQDLTTESDRGTVVESNHVTPGPSGSGKSSLPSTQNQNKTPKWFKQAFK